MEIIYTFALHNSSVKGWPHITFVLTPRVTWGMTAPVREKGIFGYDGFALTEIP